MAIGPQALAIDPGLRERVDDLARVPPSSRVATAVEATLTSTT